MSLILQIAVGVCLGLLLFRFVLLHPLRRPRWTVTQALGLCVVTYTVLWVIHIAFTAWR